MSLGEEARALAARSGRAARATPRVAGGLGLASAVLALLQALEERSSGRGRLFLLPPGQGDVQMQPQCPVVALLAFLSIPAAGIGSGTGGSTTTVDTSNSGVSSAPAAAPYASKKPNLVSTLANEPLVSPIVLLCVVVCLPT